MIQPLKSDTVFNPYCEQLAAEILTFNAQKPTKDQIKKWTHLFLNAFDLGIDNLIQNQDKILGIAKILNDAAITLPIPPVQRPKALQDHVLEAISNQNADAAAHLLLMRFAFDVMTQGVQIALQNYAVHIASPSVAGVNINLTIPVMQQMGWIDRMQHKTATHIAKNTPFQSYTAPATAEICLIRTIHALNFVNAQAFETQEILAIRIIVPWIERLLKSENYSAALRLEGLLYENYVRRKEEEQHYQAAYRLWAPMMEEAGLKYRARIDPPRPVAKDKPVVGFFVHRASMLAHISVLHTTLQGLGDIQSLPYTLKVYAWTGHDPNMEQAFGKLGVKVIFLRDHYPIDMPAMDRLLGVRKIMEQDGVQVLVWMCVMHMKAFALGMGMAPRQIYWNVKYQVGCFNTPDDRITFHDNGDAPMVVDGQEWRSVPMTYPSQQHLLDVNKLADLRQQFAKWDIILGTMAREDILNSPSFMETVADILDANPKAVYLYTGRENLSSIQNIFKARGLSDRTVFIGWVDTVLYANLIDIYLDSWPARSGLTAFNALEAGTPIVSRILADGGAIHTQFQSIIVTHKDDGLHFCTASIDQNFDALDHGKRFFTFVETLDDYKNTVQRLIDDPVLRHNTGESFKRVAAYLADSARAGRRLDAILRDNLNKTSVL